MIHSTAEVSLKKEDSDQSISSPDEDEVMVRLARRRASRALKDKQTQKRALNSSKCQGRPLSKETRVKLTLVPTLAILYSILVSDTLRGRLSIIKYCNEKEAIVNTNKELSTKNLVSGFSSLLNVQTARFNDDPSMTPNSKNSSVSGFSSIDEAVNRLFGLTEYSLIRVTRAAATEVGGSALLKIETAIPGHLYLNDDEDETFESVEMNKEYYQELIGRLGDRPTTTFLKKRVARPRYKSDMRIYLIPRSLPCVIYCEPRMFKRDLLRGFLNLNQADRSVVISFDYNELLKELEKQGHEDLVQTMGLPTPENVKSIAQSVRPIVNHDSQQYSTNPQQGLEYANTSGLSPSSRSSFSFIPASASFDNSQLAYSYDQSRFTFQPNSDISSTYQQYFQNPQLPNAYVPGGSGESYQLESLNPNNFITNSQMSPVGLESINAQQFQQYQPQLASDQGRRYPDLSYNLHIPAQQDQGQQQSTPQAYLPRPASSNSTFTGSLNLSSAQNMGLNGFWVPPGGPNNTSYGLY